MWSSSLIVSMMTTSVDATKDDVLKILEKAFIGEGVKIK
jgi:hypothetical protein